MSVRAAVKRLCGACLLVSVSAAPVQAQEPSSAGPADIRAGSADGPKSGVYIGGQFGAMGGSFGSSHLFHEYDLVDGSGSQFGGVNVGYLLRMPSHVVFGVESDLSFGAEPASANSATPVAARMIVARRERLAPGRFCSSRFAIASPRVGLKSDATL